MVGPEGPLEGEREHFADFCRSLRFEQQVAAHQTDPHAGLTGSFELPPGHPPLTAQQDPAAPSDFSNLTWELPAGWREGKRKPMRLATMEFGDSGQSEVSVIVLSGTGGGKVANIKRWYQQVGRPEPSSEDIAGLENLEVLDKPSPLVEVSGDFSGMGRRQISDAGLLGLICELAGQTLFIKMTGPKDEVFGQREAFKAFCRSLTQDQSD